MDATSNSWNSRRGLGREIPSPLIPALERAIQEFVHDLVVDNFEGLVRDGRAGEATAEELRQSVARLYPRRLIDLPDAAWQYADAIALDDSNTLWHVLVDLWTAEEGRSEYSLEVTATVLPNGDDVTVTFEDLHML